MDILHVIFFEISVYYILRKEADSWVEKSYLKISSEATMSKLKIVQSINSRTGWEEERTPRLKEKDIWKYRVEKQKQTKKNQETWNKQEYKTAWKANIQVFGLENAKKGRKHTQRDNYRKPPKPRNGGGRSEITSQTQLN